MKKLSKNGKPIGQPTKYRPEYVDQVRTLCTEGFTDARLAKFWKVNRDTIHTWKKEYPDFLAAMNEGKERFDTDKVEKALYKRAIGYTYYEVTREPTAVVLKQGGGKGEGGGSQHKEIHGYDESRIAVTRRVKKHVAPDTTAQIFWLKNRRPERWRDVWRGELTGKDGGPIEAGFDPSRLSSAALRELMTAIGEEIKGDWQEGEENG